jgi:hypothetical protein
LQLAVQLLPAKPRAGFGGLELTTLLSESVGDSVDMTC